MEEDKKKEIKERWISRTEAFDRVCNEIERMTLTREELSMIMNTTKRLIKALELDLQLDSIQPVNDIDKSMKDTLKDLVDKVKEGSKKAGKKIKRLKDVRIILKEEKD